jgi:hypothetical protein
MRVTNTTNETMNFLKKDYTVKNGQPETVSIAAGETADIDIDPEDRYVKAALFTTALTASEKAAERAAASLAPTSGKSK